MLSVNGTPVAKIDQLAGQIRPTRGNSALLTNTNMLVLERLILFAVKSVSACRGFPLKRDGHLFHLPPCRNLLLPEFCTAICPCCYYAPERR